jgi:hypothetical protein
VGLSVWLLYSVLFYERALSALVLGSQTESPLND